MPTRNRSSSASARPTFGSSSSSVRAPECGVKPRTPFLTLLGQAGRLVARRLPLFGIAVAVALLVETLLAVVWHVPHAVELDYALVVPALTTIVYAFVAADATETPPQASAIWERILERLWAVIVIDFALLKIGDLIPIDLGMIAYVVSFLFMFADTSATIDDDVTIWSVIPLAFVRSAAAVWHFPTSVRALAIFFLELFIVAVSAGLFQLLTAQHVGNALFWSQLPVITITVPPFAAITALVYRDYRTAAAPPRETEE